MEENPEIQMVIDFILADPAITANHVILINDRFIRQFEKGIYDVQLAKKYWDRVSTLATQLNNIQLNAADAAIVAEKLEEEFSPVPPPPLP